MSVYGGQKWVLARDGLSANDPTATLPNGGRKPCAKISVGAGGCSRRKRSLGHPKDNGRRTPYNPNHPCATIFIAHERRTKERFLPSIGGVPCVRINRFMR